MKYLPKVVIGLFGSKLDASKAQGRWGSWRPSLSLFAFEDLLIQRFEMLHQAHVEPHLEILEEDIRCLSPETEIRRHLINFKDPWDFEEVYDALFSFAKSYPFEPEREEYLLHITTGTHVFQICMFLLSESRYLPGRLIQLSPPNRQTREGRYRIIDLDLSRYDRIAQRFAQNRQEGVEFLKAGIATRNLAFNQMMNEIEQVALASRAPLLLQGPTGVGKTRLARRIYELKQLRNLVQGEFVEVNCATLRGDTAMSTLFGHVRGAFTGAFRDRPGLLLRADGGLLFLDEIGELGLDEQAMLLRAIEEGCFLPVGADKERESDFQLLAGSNRDLWAEVREGRFREDLLARIDLWTWRLPPLKARQEDLEPNLEYELEEFSRREDRRVSFNREARARFLKFALSPGALWSGNFRDLNAAVIRMSTLAEGGRITEQEVEAEQQRLRRSWQGTIKEQDEVEEVLGLQIKLDRFDRVQLAEVLKVCRSASSLSDAGRQLFAISRQERKSRNDADRLRKYLARFGLSWKELPWNQQ